MNIIQAREEAMSGKTVISPIGGEFDKDDFAISPWPSKYVFGEWRVKQEPVVFEAEVSIANETLYGSGVGMIASRDMRPLIGKRVRVTVECVE